jgi:hypothetical protein
VKLSFFWYGESGQMLGLFFQFHLPKFGGEVQCGENVGVGLPDVLDAFVDLLLGVFINVKILI